MDISLAVSLIPRPECSNPESYRRTKDTVEKTITYLAAASKLCRSHQKKGASYVRVFMVLFNDIARCEPPNHWMRIRHYSQW